MPTFQKKSTAPAVDPSLFTERIPFALAISDDRFFGKAWRSLSLPQQVALKIAYGLPLADGEEMRLWAAFQGFGVYDELGFLLDVTQIPPYVPKEYDIVNGLIGRRSGKSDAIGGLAGAYEITLGGHSKFSKAGIPTFWLYIAQDLDTAKLNLKFVLSWIKDSPVLSKMILKEGEEEVHFANGITLKAEPPNIRTGRGAAVCGITMDEMAFWYKNAKAANPDFEVIRALEYAQMQFPHAKQFRITTPWTKEGVAYLSWKAGTEGRNLPEEDREEYEGELLLYSPTAAMQNPKMTRRKLLRLWKRDKEAFKRESLAQFIDSQASFLTYASVEVAIDQKVGRLFEAPMLGATREPVPGIDYVAAMDPAFRHDSFAFVIGHNDKKFGIVQDYVREWIPEPGERLNPREVLTEIRDELVKWGLDLVYSDQYQYEAIQDIGESLGLSIVSFDLTKKSKPKMMATLQSLFNQRKVRLLNVPSQEAQLKKLIKTTGPSGYVNVSAPAGHRDDLAMCLALMMSQAVLMPAYEGNMDQVPGQPQKQSFISKAELEKIWKRHVENSDPEFLDQQMKHRALLEAFE
jgi:hypothetical protein